MKKILAILLVVFLAIQASHGMPLGVQPGDIVITEFFEGLWKIDPVTGARTHIPTSEGIGFSDDIAATATGTILVPSGGQIKEVNPATGQVSTFFAGPLNSLNGLAVEPSGTVLSSGNDPDLRRMAASGGSAAPLVNNPHGFFSVKGVAVGPSGRIFLPEFFQDLWEANPATGTVSRVPVADNLGTTGLITAQPTTGDLIAYLWPAGSLARIDSDSGATTTLSTDLPTFPKGLAAEANGDIVLSALSGVFRYDGETWARTTLTEGQPGEFFSPHGIAVVMSVPEPSSLVLLAVAGAGWGYVRWRRKRRTRPNPGRSLS